MRKFPAKVLLFGEHTVLRGSEALVMPLWAKYGYWQEGGTPEQQGGLVAFADYLDKNFPRLFAIERMRRDLAGGRYLASNVPEGYGLGSSGGVCVAVFQTYATKAGRDRCAAEGEQAFFARMEAHFHGASSGIDPLVIYLEKTLHLRPGGQRRITELSDLPAHWTLFLLDTGRSRKTAPLVDYFTHRYDTDADFRAAVDDRWSRPANAAIAALQNGDAGALWSAFRAISRFQIETLPPMILPELRPIWQNGLGGDHYALKICGAGGGGYCLGLSRDWPRTQAALADWEVMKI